VNFFGHAVVASSRSDSSPFLFGAMVPDFATMVGARVPSSTHAEVASGIRFHHRTDAVFHELSTFRELSASARRRLRELGLPRPATLAVGHIGVEILLDGALVTDTAWSTYLSALGAGQSAAVRSSFAWADGTMGPRFDALVAILVERRAAADQSGLAAFRIIRALAPRPRLRLDEAGEGHVRTWVEEARGEVHAAAARLLAELDAGLAEHSSAIP
jgi:hypothetical protein